MLKDQELKQEAGDVKDKMLEQKGVNILMISGTCLGILMLILIAKIYSEG